MSSLREQLRAKGAAVMTAQAQAPTCDVFDYVPRDGALVNSAPMPPRAEVPHGLAGDLGGMIFPPGLASPQPWDTTSSEEAEVPAHVARAQPRLKAGVDTSMPLKKRVTDYLLSEPINVMSRSGGSYSIEMDGDVMRLGV